MDRALNRKIRQVRVRWSVNRLLVESSRVLGGMGLLSGTLLFVDRLLGVSLWSRPVLGWIALGAAVVLLYRWIPLVPNRLQTSLGIDHRLRLRERFSSLVALEEVDDPFARAACVEAGRFLTDVEPVRKFPLRLTRFWFVALGLWFLVGLLHFFLPTFDLLGRQEQERQRLAQVQQWKTVENEIRDTTAAVKQIAERLDHPLLNDALADMNVPPTAPTPELAQRQAIRRLGDLADRIRQSQSTSQALTLLQQALKQLRPGAGDLSRQLQLALARGEFQRASQRLRDLEKMLRQGNLSQTQQDDLARQLNDLAGQMKALASERSALAEALEKLGLDQALSQLDPQSLRRALQQKGIAQAQIQELLEQQAASQLAQDRLAALSEALAGAGAGGGLSAEGLAAALSEVDELAALQQQDQLSDAALAAIDQAIGALGQCMGQGLGGEGEKGPFQPGDSRSFSRGSGGPGRGSGEVDSDAAGDFDTKKTRLENAGQGGPAIASWYFQGPQSAGQTQRSWQEVLQASREQAAEAIDENRIPGKYHDSVKRYFGDLEDAGDKP